MSRFSFISGKCYRSNGKSPDVPPVPEWRAEKVFAAQRLARRPSNLRSDKLHQLADVYQPKARMEENT